MVVREQGFLGGAGLRGPWAVLLCAHGRQPAASSQPVPLPYTRPLLSALSAALPVSPSLTLDDASVLGEGGAHRTEGRCLGTVSLSVVLRGRLPASPWLSGSPPRRSVGVPGHRDGAWGLALGVTCPRGFFKKKFFFRGVDESSSSVFRPMSVPGHQGHRTCSSGQLGAPPKPLLAPGKVIPLSVSAFSQTHMLPFAQQMGFYKGCNVDFSSLLNISYISRKIHHL